jgi:leucyl/phenylalanyl-tRNA--protein transferase
MGNDFPYLSEQERFAFPSVEKATTEGVVAWGGNLSPGMLLSAYQQGLFPWFAPGEPILWWSPDPRYILFPAEVHVSQSMRKVLRKGGFSVTFDFDFHAVIRACGDVPRPGQNGTWITDDMLRAYRKLHDLGYAHSAEVWQGGRLVGGLYGVSLGRCFFGESMFSLVSNASKVALITLARSLEQAGFYFIDCQIYTPHLESMGARPIARKRFIAMLEDGLQLPTIKGSWHSLLNN